MREEAIESVTRVTKQVQRMLRRLARPRALAWLAALLAVQPGSLGLAQISVAGDLIYIQEGVRPGDSYSGTLTLINLGSAVATATVYLNDVSFEAGELAYLEPGTEPRSNAGWIELELGSVQIEGGESATVGYTVTVPEDPGLHDSYWSMVMVENAPVGAGPTEQGVNIRSVTRYGVYLVTNFSQRTPLQLDFVDPVLQTDEQSGAVFSVAVVNAGRRLVRPASYLEIFDSNGVHVGRVDSDPALIFPNARVGHKYRLGNLPPGDYMAIAVVDAGGEDVFGARYTLRVGTP
jgi:hypothetical protein